MSDFDSRYNIEDVKYPPNSLMMGRFKRSFAYYTLRERLPVIITQVLDNLHRDKDQIAKECGEEAREELKKVLGQISKLKYELQTDKPLMLFMHEDIDFHHSEPPDWDMWNDFLMKIDPEDNSFFSVCWLYAECYMYRRLRFFFELTNLLQNYDFFRKQKENALTCCSDTLDVVASRVNERKDCENVGDFFRRLLKLNLWGNRCDLSISEGKEIKQTGDPFSAIDELEANILVDNTAQIWQCVSTAPADDRIVDFVNDNSGYELFTDLLIADFLIEKNLASKVRFHVKPIPWYISDVTHADFNWTLDYLSKHESDTLKNLANKWQGYLKDGRFVLEDIEYFWTTAYEYYRMPEVSKSLYDKLAEARLVIFKGDLNYRKLIGDFTWKYTEPFKTCLRGFQPTNLCTLRTVKADLICGLGPGVAEALTEKDPNWMTTGEYGLIQFSGKN